MNKHIAIILVAPQMGENIGASARAMKNFALSDLRIVQPRDGWPNYKAEAMSVGAIDLIRDAKIFSTIEEAVSDLSYIYATTGVSRDMHKQYVSSKNLATDLPSSTRVGIMFGRENNGLANDEINYANKILVIDTVKDFTSLNLAHAVAVVAYELFSRQNQIAVIENSDFEPVLQSEINFFYEQLFTKLSDKGFFRVLGKEPLMSGKIRNIFNRIDKLSKSELQTLYGIMSVLSSDKVDKK